MIWLLTFCVSSGVVNAKAERLEYDVAFEIESHYAVITLRVPAPRRGHVEFLMPVWTPGSYLIREHARHVESVSATDDSGRLLPVTKSSKNRWVVACVPGEPFVVQYRLYCREMSVRTNWVDRELALLNGAPTFLTIPDKRNLPHRVKLIMPPRWKTSVTSMPEVADQPHTYEAMTHEELVDSPILCGNPVGAFFEVGDVKHLLANAGDTKMWDIRRAASDVEAVVREHQRMWGSVPYPKYAFLNLIVEARGGLEHNNSSVMMTSRWNFRDKEKYEDWLSLISHEFFHTWNVRRLRPRDLLHYDPDRENYTRCLWIAEGITSYYEDLALVRAGLIDEDAFLKRFSKNIATVQENSGRRVQSLSDASYDAWIKFYRPDENSSNTRISYYSKGAVAAFLLDARIRQLTSNNRSLDDVMRKMYSEFAGDRGYSNEDFRRVATQIAEHDLSGWFETHIDQTKELIYDDALQWLGLEFKPENDVPEVPSESDAGKKESKKSADETKKVRWMGVAAKPDSGRLLVTKVQRDSPAYTAGINVGDELLAVEGFRLTTAEWQKQLNQFEIGSAVQILLSRRGRIVGLPVTLREKPKNLWALRAVSKRTDAQRQAVASWLNLTPTKTPAKTPTPAKASD